MVTFLVAIPLTIPLNRRRPRANGGRLGGVQAPALSHQNVVSYTLGFASFLLFVIHFGGGGSAHA